MELKTKNGYTYYIDDADFTRLLGYGWYGKFSTRDSTPYIVANARIGDKRTTIRLSRLLLHASSRSEVDHINGDGLDNRRANLRLCTRRQNAKNRHRNKNNTSGYKGVHFDRASRKWKAYIGTRPQRSIGRFKCAAEAALAYNAEAIKLFGKFAKLNIIYQF